MKSDVKYPQLLPRFARPVPRRLAQARQFTRTAFGARLPAALDLAGWLHPDQAAMLCHVAHLCPAGPIVEIGSFKGKSTVFLARGMKETNSLTAIDPHLSTCAGNRRDRQRAAAAAAMTSNGNETSWEHFNRVLVDWKLTDRVAVVRDYSYNHRPKWSGTIAFLWIDGDHTYNAVKRDIEDWADLVMPGGFLAFHDTHPRYLGDGSVRRAIHDAGVLSRRGFSTYLELRNAWFMQRLS